MFFQTLVRIAVLTGLARVVDDPDNGGALDATLCGFRWCETLEEVDQDQACHFIASRETLRSAVVHVISNNHVSKVVPNRVARTCRRVHF